MILSRDKGSRMWGGGGGTGGSGGGVGFDPSMLAGYATQGWVEDNYVSKAFWTELFVIHGTQTVTITDENDDPVGDPVVTDIIFSPNEVPSTTIETDDETHYTTTTVRTITSIEAKKGVWTNFYLSALGLNSSGGGGGGASSLSELLDVAISNPTNGQALVYDTSLSPAKWVNKTLFTEMSYTNNILSVTISGVTKTVTIQAGATSIDWANITNKPTTIAGYGITDAKIANGTITLGANSITPLVASDIADMATQTWVGQNYLGLHATADAATKLATARTLWGQSFDGTANVSGTMTGVGEIHFSNNSTRIIDSSGVPGFGWGSSSPTANSSWGVYNHYANSYALYIKTDGSVGIGTTTPDYKLDVNGEGRFLNMLCVRSSDTTEGGEISLVGGAGYSDIEIDNYSGYLRIFRSGGGNCELQFNPDSRLVHINGGNGSTLRIGNGMIVWDDSNNALKVIKSDGTAGNIYATGGVSALGMSAGVSAMDAMTFNYVTVNNQISIKQTVNDVDYTHTIAGNANGKLVITGDQGIVLNGAINTNGNNITTGNASIDAGEGWVKANRLYLDGSRYLYVSGGTLYYYNGSTSKQVAFTN